ncbi:hypothetical protein [Microbulbifer guangxiensis]|uniref:hypothetical protein n=1 Tax=Microbulbifer guangxiensis TaxID=2904249 RepID=UPI001F3C73AE|nr:hypothetical protein [Microbulbifer guangxiensis]
MRKLLFLFVTALVAVSGQATASCGYEGEAFAVGQARNPGSGALVYCEYHLPAQGNERRVLYYTPQGHRIAEKRLSGVNSTVPGVVQQDYRHGEQRIVQPRGGQVELRYRDAANSGWEVETLPTAVVDVADAGFDTFVRNNWSQLSAAQTVSFAFASPLHGRAIPLRARQVGCAGGGQAQKLCLRVELDQALLRMFAGDLYLEYDRGSRRLLLFDGVTNLLDAQADSQRLRIDYRY